MQQCFQPDDSARAQLDLRLIVEFELIMVDRAAQLLRDSYAFLDSTVEVCVVKSEAVTAILFGTIEREVRLYHHGVGPRHVRCVPRHPDAGRDMNIVAFYEIWLAHNLSDLGGEHSGCGEIAGVTLQDCKLVATEARNDIGFTGRAGDASSHLAQKRIADGVAERVVDLLEMIEIEIEHGKRSRTASARGKSIIESFDKSSAIGERGKRILLCEIRMRKA